MCFFTISLILLGFRIVGLVLYPISFLVIPHVSEVRPTTLFSSIERNPRRPLKSAIPHPRLNFVPAFLVVPSGVSYMSEHAVELRALVSASDYEVHTEAISVRVLADSTTSSGPTAHG